MTSDKTPTLLAVVVKTSVQQWYVAGISLAGTVQPLVSSEPGNLSLQSGQSEDEQLSFLRHRLSGAMQRGFDRLWAKDAKAARIVLIADDDIAETKKSLLPRLAEHFHVWMTRPPVSCYRGHGSATIEDLHSLECLIGPLDAEFADPLGSALPALCQQMTDQDAWELIPTPRD